jgi:hypothetical protein
MTGEADDAARRTPIRRGINRCRRTIGTASPVDQEVLDELPEPVDAVDEDAPDDDVVGEVEDVEDDSEDPPPLDEDPDELDEPDEPDEPDRESVL